MCESSALSLPVLPVRTADLLFQHDELQHSDALIDAQQLQRQVQREVDEREASVVGQRKRHARVLLPRQQLQLEEQGLVERIFVSI